MLKLSIRAISDGQIYKRINSNCRKALLSLKVRTSMYEIDKNAVIVDNFQRI